MQGKGSHTTKTFNRLYLQELEKLVGAINALNIMWSKSVSSSLLKKNYHFKNRNIC